jgi:hypothetical protein
MGIETKRKMTRQRIIIGLKVRRESNQTNELRERRIKQEKRKEEREEINAKCIEK